MNRRQHITRRTFLKSAAGAAAAFPYIVPSSALGNAGSVAPSERITIGVTVHRIFFIKNSKC